MPEGEGSINGGLTLEIDIFILNSERMFYYRKVQRLMQQQILFIHSAGPQGTDTGSGPLVAALETALGPGFSVVNPPMPNPEDPAYAPWKNQLEQTLAELRGPAILVGHSLGGSVLVKYLAEIASMPAVAGLFLVAAPYWGGDANWQYDQFLLPEDAGVSLASIRPACLYYTRDDTVVPFAHLALYAALLPQATVRALDGYGHGFINGSADLVRDIVAASANARV